MLFSNFSDKLFCNLAFVFFLHVYICVLRKFCIFWWIFAFVICVLLYLCPALVLHLCGGFVHFLFLHCSICALCWFCICAVDLRIFHLCIVVFVLCVGFAFVWWIACGRNQSGNHGCNSHNALKSKKPNDDPADCWQVKRKHFDVMIINCIGDHKNKRFTSLNW